MFSHGNPLRDLRLIENERTLIDREVDHLLGQQAQPSATYLVRKRIRSRLRRLRLIRSRLDDEEAELRSRESDLLRMYHGRHTAGSPASSSRETGVEEHVSEVSSNELGGTSTDLSEIGALMLDDDTYHTLESGDNRVEEHAGEVSNTELGGTSTDLLEFEALMLNDDTFHTPESAHRMVMHVDTVDSGMLDSTIGEPSALEEKKPSEIPRKYWPPKFAGTVIFARRQAEREFAERQAQSLQARGQCTYASKDEIVRNANKWMSEEVMVAFRRYIESEDDLKDIEYEFEKLLHQCFNVAHYFKICHHFNFTVKIKKCESADWTPMTFFAEDNVMHVTTKEWIS